MAGRPDSVIDSDVHVPAPATSALLRYLPEFWRETIRLSGFKGPADSYYPPGGPISARPGSQPTGGKTRLDLIREQVLDPLGAEVAILNCAYAVDGIRNPDAAEAFARATNDWLIDEWLARDSRFRASMLAPVQYPDMAAREIDRVGGHPGFVQVFLPVYSATPYGNRRYYPLFEAVVRNQLVAGIQFGGASGVPTTPMGWPTYVMEEYAGAASVFQSQVLSLVCEGTFDRFPDLRVACIEGGFTWLPSLMWRLDKDWKGLRREVPWVRRPPSDYIKQHLRFSTQPIDGPGDPTHLAEVVNQIGSDDLLMFATDYPHWHADELPVAFPVELPAARRRKIMAENARSFYRL